jgi:Zn-dependent protease with chaperone function
VSAERLYRLQVGLGAAGLAASLLAVAAGVRAVHVAPSAAHRLDLSGLSVLYPAANPAALLLLALAGAGAVVLASAIRAAWRQARGQRRVLRALPVSGSLPGQPAVLVVDARAALAFCAGWLRPRVYVSTGVLDRLTDSELRAVVAHERRHGAHRDPLRLAVSAVLCQALFFLPVLRSLHATYADAAELAADAAAVEAVGGVAPVASAMLAVDGATRTHGVSPARVDALLGRPAPPAPPRPLLLAALLTLALVLVLDWRAGAGASVHAGLGYSLVP